MLRTSFVVFTGLSCSSSDRLAVDAADATGNRSGTATLMRSPAACPAGARVSVVNTSAGTVTTRFSTNNVWSGSLDQFAAGVANFKALNLPLVRLHVGDDGYPVAMPEVKQGQWSFAALDTLVNDEFSIGQQPLMNIKFAPDWMWTCTAFQGAGTVADQTFQTFAAYMARLVSYYNKGSMTTENGTVITNPAGRSHRITYWELWNEPDLANETPCAPASGEALTPTQYLTMWNAVTKAMLAVDPALKFIGPATADGQFGSTTGVDNPYITALMSAATVKPYALSFHGYGYWDNSVSDATIFNGDGSPGINGGIDDIAAAARAVHSAYPRTPIWITEINVNADWGNDPHGRPWGPFAAAWWGSAWVQLAPLSVAMIDQYDICDGPQFGLINDQTGAPYLPYWILKTLNRSFPAGSTLLRASSSDSNIQTLAARRPDGKISILVLDRRIDPANPSGGFGLPADVQVSLARVTAKAVTLQQIDANTSTASGPTTRSVSTTRPFRLHLPGYGLTVLTVTP